MEKCKNPCQCDTCLFARSNELERSMAARDRAWQAFIDQTILSKLNQEAAQSFREAMRLISK